MQSNSTTTKNNRNSSQDEVTFTIKDHVGVLSTSQSGWTREVNIVSWNQRPARLDIRDWNPEHTKMSRGIGLNGNEVSTLRDLLDDMDIGMLEI